MLESKAVDKNHFEELGIIQVWGAIDSALSQNICEKIITFNSQDRLEYIQMLINSQGGSCSDGFAIIDMMAWSRLPIRTIGIGLIASLGLSIFISGEKGSRIVTPNTSIMAHRFRGMHGGNHADLVASRKEEDHLHQRFVDHFIRNSHLKTTEEVNSKLLREVDTWLTPSEALEFGLVDVLLDNPASLIRKQV